MIKAAGFISERFMENQDKLGKSFSKRYCNKLLQKNANYTSHNLFQSVTLPVDDPEPAIEVASILGGG
jgi:hypothetical protein